MRSQADEGNFNSPLYLCLAIGSSKPHLNLHSVTGLQEGPDE